MSCSSLHSLALFKLSEPLLRHVLSDLIDYVYTRILHSNRFFIRTFKLYGRYTVSMISLPQQGTMGKVKYQIPAGHSMHTIY